MTRPDEEHGKPIVPFKSGWRAKIESHDKKWGYTIIANIGDQQSDLPAGKPANTPNARSSFPTRSTSSHETLGIGRTARRQSLCGEPR
jgi:hypothetical protein